MSSAVARAVYISRNVIVFRQFSTSIPVRLQFSELEVCVYNYCLIIYFLADRLLIPSNSLAVCIRTIINTE